MIRARFGQLAPVGAISGALTWGCVGIWRTYSEDNYPWNQTNPILTESSYGVLCGILAALVGVLAARWLARKAQHPLIALFVGSLLGGLLLGTVLDLSGAPAPVPYYENSIPDHIWYGLPLVQHWVGYTLLPALGCAVVLAGFGTLLPTYARTERPLWPAGLWLALAFALFVLPYQVGYEGEVHGNGEHVNEGAAAVLIAWFTGLLALLTGLLQLLVTGILRLTDKRSRREDSAPMPHHAAGQPFLPK